MCESACETSTSSFLDVHLYPEQLQIVITTIDLTLYDAEENRNTRESTVISDDFVLPITTDPHHNPDPDSDPIDWKLATYHNTDLPRQPSKAVKLQTGDFLRISCILQPRNLGQILVKSHCFRRNTKFGGLLKKKPNEVAMELRLDFQPFKSHAKDERSAEEQSIESGSLADIVEIRNLIFINK